MRFSQNIARDFKPDRLLVLIRQSKKILLNQQPFQKNKTLAIHQKWNHYQPKF